VARLTDDQWAAIRAEREASGTSFRDLAAKHGVSDAAIVKRAKKENWGDGRSVEKLVREKVSEKVSGIVSGANHKKRAEAIDAEAEKRAAVIERHRGEWPEAREMVERGREAHKVAENLNEKRIAFEDLKAAKIASETLKIIQDGERKAWGLDAIIDVTALTDEQLAAIAKGRMPI
jgi:hypothetical protein